MSTIPGPWRCSRCEAERTADDDFCGRCGERRPRPVDGLVPGAESVAPDVAPEATDTATRGGFPVARALILNGVLVGAVLLAFLLGRGNGGPTAIAFQPTSWRCDGSERTWIAAVPANALDVRVEWLTGGPVGEVRASMTVPRVELEAFATEDGSFRVTSVATDAPECALDAGRYTMALRDAASGALLAYGDVGLER